MHVPIPVGPVDEEDAAFAVGSLIGGKYVVERALGCGGLGVVVVARHCELGQRVAIKYLREAGRTNSSVVERFRREARIAAQIRSDHVVRVHDVGEVADIPFIVMELLEGRDLGHALAEGAMTTQRAVDYVLQACEGLAEIHALGITHRDLKPENLFLVQDRVRGASLKIIDFGISKVTPSQTNGDWASVTSEGERFGTPAYMSPEQLGLGGGVDCRTDVWALGVVLFELLARDLPFQGEDVQHMFVSIVMSAPTLPSSVVPGIPAGLEAAILGCLEKDADKRFQNVAQLARRLAPFGSTDALERVRRIEMTLALAGVDVPSCVTFVESELTPPPEVAPPSLRAVALPTVIIPRFPVRRRGARLLASLCASALGLGALLYLGQREHKAGAALPPDAPASVAAPVATFMARVQPVPTASSAAVQSPIPSTSATKPVPPPRPSFRSTTAIDSPAPPRAPGTADRRALYGERK